MVTTYNMGDLFTSFTMSSTGAPYEVIPVTALGVRCLSGLTHFVVR